jgi:hypothetical protein
MSIKPSVGQHRLVGNFRAAHANYAPLTEPIEASLTRLKTDLTGLRWVHMSDGVTPVEVIVRGFGSSIASSIA